MTEGVLANSKATEWYIVISVPGDVAATREEAATALEYAAEQIRATGYAGGHYEVVVDGVAAGTELEIYLSAPGDPPVGRETTPVLGWAPSEGES